MFLSEISRLFEIHMPGYSCKAIRQEDGSLSCQFTDRTSQATITITGLTTAEVCTPEAVADVSKSLLEEIACATGDVHSLLPPLALPQRW
ncbi:hypothetical protein NRL37_13615 [Metapseudomonas otitidis]|uniref:hypothetical protein n=1 Tax=Metapseudomonas otitidis TaxID=319939 RepID=UPI00227D3A3A|nr:hypothetical protein [Pseudomonas otitidis]WAF88433.1 hypothetical protein NRL37_13615 [Pseudomonas otitidis]